jgi:hypothetical protein
MTSSIPMNRVPVAVGAAEVLGAVALVIMTFTIPAFADMAFGWRMLAVFMILEGSNRVLDNTNL